MPSLTILEYPDPALAQVCEPAEPGDDLNILAQAMLLTMYEAQGRGLAAPQIGERLRLFVMDTSWLDGKPDPKVFANPEITWSSDDTDLSPEGCLSIPGMVLEVPRARRIRLAWTALDGTAKEAEFDGFAAAAIQHEVDHLNGIVIFDRLDPHDRESALDAFLA